MKNFLNWKNGVVAILVLWLINLMTKKPTTLTPIKPTKIDYAPTNGPANIVSHILPTETSQPVQVPIDYALDSPPQISLGEIPQDTPNDGYIKPDYHYQDDQLYIGSFAPVYYS